MQRYVACLHALLLDCAAQCRLMGGALLCTAEFVSDEQLFAKKLKFPELSDQAKFVPPKKDDVAGLVRACTRAPADSGSAQSPLVHRRSSLPCSDGLPRHPAAHGPACMRAPSNAALRRRMDAQVADSKKKCRASFDNTDLGRLILQKALRHPNLARLVDGAAASCAQDRLVKKTGVEQGLRTVRPQG